MSNATLPTSAVVVVIDGGVIGTSLAYRPSEAGLPLLIEAGQLGAGSLRDATPRPCSAGVIRLRINQHVASQTC